MRSLAPNSALCKKIIFFALVTGFCFKNNGQSIYKVSDYNNYFAEGTKIKTSKAEAAFQKYLISVYYLPRQEAILSFTVMAHDKLSNIDISSSGHLLALEFGSETRVFDVLSKTEIKQVHLKYRIHLPHYDHFFLVEGQEMVAYESFSGKEIIRYNGSAKKTFALGLIISESDQHIIVKNSANSFYLWKAGESRRYKKFNGSQIRLDYRDNIITVLNNYRANTYDLNNFRKGYETDLSKTGHEFEKSQKARGEPVSVKPQLNIVSPAGNFVLLPFVNANKNYQLLLVSTRRPEYFPLKFELAKYDSCRWLNDTSMIFHFTKAASKILSFSANTGIQTAHEFFYSGNVSPDYSTLAEEKFGLSHSKLKVTNTFNGNTFKADASEFLAFTPNSRVMIVKKGKREGVIFLDSVDKKFRPFKDSVIPVKEFEMEESDPPPGYKSNQIISFKHIGDKNDSSEINLVLKNIERKDSIVKINLHLIDDKGNYFYGASSEAWKSLWCNFILKNESGKLKQISNFTVTEHQQRDSVPCAIMLALDHSGSMGQSRALLLQKTSKAFIEKKEDRDAFGIIKYDSQVSVEVKPTKDKSKLLNELKMDGLGKFGKSTALLEAANVGVSNLKMMSAFQRKAVLLLTDGNENSSRISREEVIKRAWLNGIKIHCIGFGKNVSEDYLKNISEGTDGSFYHIYRKSDFKWIFDDIYHKMSNYYEFKFKLEDYGKFVAFLKICNGPNSSEVKVNLFRSKPGEKLNDTSRVSEKAEPEADSLLKKNISDYSAIRLKKENGYKPAIQSLSDTVDLVAVEEEFDKLIFPNIKFKLDLSEVVEGTDKGIENVVEFMRRYPFVRIEIAGHTDDAGDSKHNAILSLQRAEAVKSILEKMGVAGKKLSAKGYGEEHPMVPNTSEENRLINRRVEFVIMND